MIRNAAFSEDSQFRYWLSRAWGKGRGLAVWIMLNPSTADAEVDDPTIRRVIGFSRLWGYAAAEVVNLFAYRSPSPKALEGAGFPVGGPSNDESILETVSKAEIVVAAWGAHAPSWRVEEIRRRLAIAGVQVQCLGTTAKGFPRHPLYVPAHSRLSLYWRA